MYLSYVCIYQFMKHCCFVVQSNGTNAITGQQKKCKKSAMADIPLRMKREPVKSTQTSFSPKVLTPKLLVVVPVGVVNQFDKIIPVLSMQWFKT